MRRFMGLLVITAMLFGLLALAGCGTSTPSGAVQTPAGTISVKNGKITVTKPNGSKVTWTTATIAESEIGLPVYPGAKVDKQSLGAVKTGVESWAGVTAWSNDTVDKVTAYYQQQLSGMSGYTNYTQTLDGQLVGMFSVRSGSDTKTVIASAGQSGDPGATMITYATAKGAK